MTNSDIITGFLRSWATGGLVRGIEDLFSDDAVWRNSGFPACEGKAACIALAERYVPTLPLVDVDLLAIAENDDVVFTQRIDHCKNPEGSPVVSAEVCGVFKLRDGRVVSWYDYFDPNEFPDE